MKDKKLLKEKVSHGTLDLPIFIHYNYISKKSANSLYLHWHGEIEFLFVTKGSATFYIEDHSYKLDKHCGLFVLPNQLHYGILEESKDCEFYAIVFDSTFLFDDINSSLYKAYMLPVLSKNIVFSAFYDTTIPWQDEVLSLLFKISELQKENLSNYELLIKGKMLELWHLFFTNATKSADYTLDKTYNSQRLKVVIDYIHEKYAYNITLNELSCLIPISEGQLCRIFKDTLGLTPFNYITRYRIQKSLELLKNDDKKIADIASLVGFNNISYFNRAFLDLIKCTPKEYRRTLSSY